MKKLTNLINKADDKLMDFINRLDLKCCLCVLMFMFCSFIFSGIAAKYNMHFLDKISILFSVIYFSNFYREFMKQIKRKH